MAKEKNNKAEKQKTKGEEKYIWPFNFAIGAKRLNPIPMPDATEGKEFTKEDILKVLKPMVLELNLDGASIHYLEDHNTFVMVGALARKG